MSHATEQTDLAQWQDELEIWFAANGIDPLLVRVYQETKSTQDIAKSFAPGPALVVADQQTAGRGRLGRAWLSAPGSAVLMSLVYPNNAAQPTHDRVSMLVGVAVANAVEALAPDVPVRLKWPNDVMVDGKKLAGILIETVQGSSVIGIGLNVLPAHRSGDALSAIATSLHELGYRIDRLAVVKQVVGHVIRCLATSGQQDVLTMWRGLASLGQTQTFEHNKQRISGEVIDLDPDHGLIVRRDSGEMITLPAATTSVVG